MAGKITKSMNPLELMEQFPDEEKCRSTLEELRWPDGVRCPRCNAPKVYRMNTRAQFYCETCTYQFSVTSGTIFHDTHLPLRKWLIAIYLILDSEKRFSANQMKRTVGVSYKTAWYLCHRIRAAMTELDQTPLKGTVEVDERCISSIKDNTATDTEVIITDDWKAYKGIGDHDTNHEVVNHSAKGYVLGDRVTRKALRTSGAC
jgi:transposase-like protein